jgi:hypothetical protein
MYSLGIVFFEMNFSFSTQSERIAVLEELGKPEVVFPDTWQGRFQQRQSERHVANVCRMTSLTYFSSHNIVTSARCRRSPYSAAIVQERAFTSKSPG